MKPISTPRRTVAMVAVVALVVIGAIGWWLSRPDDTAVAGLPARTVQAGAVEVIMTPLALDASGAMFQVTLDTHSVVALDLDVASSARLRVGDSTVDGASWDGKGPGGHHREGTLRFHSDPVRSRRGAGHHRAVGRGDRIVDGAMTSDSRLPAKSLT